MLTSFLSSERARLPPFRKILFSAGNAPDPYRTPVISTRGNKSGPSCLKLFADRVQYRLRLKRCLR